MFMLRKFALVFCVFCSLSNVALASGIGMLEGKIQFASKMTQDQRNLASKTFEKMLDTNCGNLATYAMSVKSIKIWYEDDLEKPTPGFVEGQMFVDHYFENYGWTFRFIIETSLHDSVFKIDPVFKNETSSLARFSIGLDGKHPGIVNHDLVSTSSILCGFPPVRKPGSERFVEVPELAKALQ